MTENYEKQEGRRQVRKMAAFRLFPDQLERLANIARQWGVTKTGALERMIEQAGRDRGAA